MSNSTVDALVARISADPALQIRCRNASTADDLRVAIVEAGFDPDDPAIAAAVFGAVELEEHDLETTTGGIASDARLASAMMIPIDELVGWGP